MSDEPVKGKISVQTPIGLPGADIVKAPNQAPQGPGTGFTQLPSFREMMPKFSPTEEVDPGLSERFGSLGALPSQVDQTALQGQMASDQGNIEAAGKTVLLNINNMLAGAGMGLGALLDFPAWAAYFQGENADFSNAITDWASGFRKDQDAYVHRENPQATDLTDPKTWMALTNDASFSLGIMLPGLLPMLATRGKMDPMKGASPMARFLGSAAASSVIQRHGESYIEAADAGKNIYDSAISLGYTPEEADKMRATASANVYAENLKLVFVDFLQTAAVFGAAKNLSGLRGNGFSRFLDKKYVTYPFTMASEGAEELYQHVLGERAADDALRGTYLPEKTLMGKSLESFGDPLAQRAMLSGAFGGAAFHLFGPMFQKVTEGRKWKEFIKENKLDLANNYTPEQIEKVRDDNFLDMVRRHAQAKSLNKLQDHFDTLAKATDEQVAASSMNKEEYMKEVSRRQNQIVEMGKLYNSIYYRKGDKEIKDSEFIGYSGKILLDENIGKLTEELNEGINKATANDNTLNVVPQLHINSLMKDYFSAVAPRNEHEAAALETLQRKYEAAVPNGYKREVLTNDAELQTKAYALASYIYEKQLVDDAITKIKSPAYQNELKARRAEQAKQDDARKAAIKKAQAEQAQADTAAKEQAANGEAAKAKAEEVKRREALEAADAEVKQQAENQRQLNIARIAPLVKQDGADALSPEDAKFYKENRQAVNDAIVKGTNPIPAAEPAVDAPLDSKERMQLYDLGYDRETVQAMDPTIAREAIKEKRKPEGKPDETKPPVVDKTKPETILNETDTAEETFNLLYEYARPTTVFNKLALFSRNFFESFYVDAENNVKISRQAYENKLADGMINPQILSDRAYPIGTALSFEVLDDPEQAMYSGENNRRQTTWGKYVAENNIAPEDRHLFVPIMVKDAAGKPVAFLHTLDWVTEANVKPTEEFSITDNRTQLAELRYFIAEKGTVHGEITDRGFGSLSQTAFKEPIPISQGMPNAEIIVLNERGEIEGDVDLAEEFNNFKDRALGKDEDGNDRLLRFRPGQVLAYVAGRSPVFAFTEGRQLSKTEVDSIALAVANFAVSDEGITDAAKAFGAKVKEVMGLDLSSAEGLKQYLKNFINITSLDPGIKSYEGYNSPLAYQTRDYETGNYFLAVSGNAVMWAEGGGVGGKNISRNTRGVQNINQFMSDLAALLGKMPLNVNRTLLNKKDYNLVVYEDKAPQVKKIDYTEFIKDNFASRVFGFNVGTEEDPDFIYYLNPVIQFEVTREATTIPKNEVVFTSPKTTETVTEFNEQVDAMEQAMDGSASFEFDIDDQLPPYEEEGIQALEENPVVFQKGDILISLTTLKELDSRKRARGVQLNDVLKKEYPSLKQSERAEIVQEYKRLRDSIQSELIDAKKRLELATQKSAVKKIREAKNLEVGLQPKAMVLKWLLENKIHQDVVRELYKTRRTTGQGEVNVRAALVDGKAHSRSIETLAEEIYEDYGSPESLDSTDFVNAVEEAINEFTNRTDIAVYLLEVFNPSMEAADLAEAERQLAALSRQIRKEKGTFRGEMPESDERPMTDEQMDELYEESDDSFLIKGITPLGVQRLVNSISSFVIKKVVNYDKKNMNVKAVREIFAEVKEMLEAKQVDYLSKLAMYDKYKVGLPEEVMQDKPLVIARLKELNAAVSNFEQLRKLVFLDIHSVSGVNIDFEKQIPSDEVGYNDATPLENDPFDEDQEKADQVTEDMEIAELLENLPGDRSESYETIGRLKKTAKQSASTSLKLFIKTLNSKEIDFNEEGKAELVDEVNSFGIVETLDANDVFEFLIARFANRYLTSAAILAELKTLQKTHIWVNSLVEGLEKNSKDLQIDLHSVLTKATTTMNYMLEFADRERYHSVVLDDNIGETTKLIRRIWASGMKVGPLLETEQADYFVVKAQKDKWLEWSRKWFKEAQSSTNPKYARVPPPAEFKQFLALFGIQLNDRLFDKITKGSLVSKGSFKGKTGFVYDGATLTYADQFNSTTGIVYNLALMLSKMSDAEGKVTRAFEDVYSIGVIEALARAEAKDNPYIRGTSFRSGDKTISSHSSPSYIEKRTFDLKNGKLAQLASKIYNGAAYWIKEFSAKESLDKLKQSLMSLSPVREFKKVNFNREFKRHSEFSREKIKINMFFNFEKVAVSKETTKLFTKYFYPTLGNNPVVSMITGPKEEFFVDVPTDDETNNDMSQGLVNDKMVNYIYNNIFLSEARRITQAQGAATKPFEQGKNIFFNLPFLNTLPGLWDANHNFIYSKDRDAVVTKDQAKAVNDAIRTYLEGVIAAKIKKWQGLGIGVGPKLKFINDKYVDRIVEKLGNKAKTNTILKSAAADFVVNNMLALHSLQAMYTGDLALYYKQAKVNEGLSKSDPKYSFEKDVDATVQGMMKRLRTEVGAADQMFADDKPLETEPVKVLVIDDVFTTLKDSGTEEGVLEGRDYYKSVGMTDEQINKYDKINIGDGTLINHPLEHIELMWRFKKITTYQYEQAKIYFKEHGAMPKWLPITTMKLRYLDMLDWGESAVRMHIKNADFFLSTEMLPGNEFMSRVYELMGGKNNDVQKVAFKSTIKTGFVSAYKMYNPDGTLNTTPPTADNYVTINRSGLQLQTTTKNRENDRYTTLSTQAVKQLFSDIGEFFPKELKEYHELYSDIVTNQMNKFYDDIGFDRTKNTFDIEKFSKVLKDHLKKYTNDINLLKSVDIVAKELELRMKSPLFVGGGRGMIEPYSMSMISGIVEDIYFPGSTYTIASELFVSPNTKGITYVEGFDPAQGLRHYRKEGETVHRSQVIMSWPFADLDINNFKKNGKIDMSLIPKELLELIGTRIPVAKQSSIHALEIVGFLPENYKSTMILSHQLIAQTGWDFDDDKLFFYFKEYTKDKETKMPVVDTESSKNKMLDIFGKVLLSPKDEVRATIHKTVDTKILEPIYDTLYEKNISGQDISPINEEYFSKLYQDQASASDMIGVMANLMNLHAVIMDIPKAHALSVNMGNSKLYISGEVSDRMLGKKADQSSEGHFISDNIQNGLQAAVDDANLGYLKVMNVNNYTFSALTQAILEGFSLKASFAVINQNIVKEYIAINERLKREQKKGSYKLNVITELNKTFPNPTITEILNDKSLSSAQKYEQVLEYGKALLEDPTLRHIKIDEYLQGDFEAKDIVNWESYFTYLNLNNAGRLLSSAQNMIAVDSSGYGKSLIHAQNKIDFPLNLPGDTRIENFDRLLGEYEILPYKKEELEPGQHYLGYRDEDDKGIVYVYMKPKTIYGIATLTGRDALLKTLLSTEHLVYPYQTRSYQTVLDRIFNTIALKERDYFERNKITAIIHDELVAYLNSSYSTNIYDVKNSDPSKRNPVTQRRYELVIDTRENQSVATILDFARRDPNYQANPLIASLFPYIEKNGEPSLVEYQGIQRDEIGRNALPMGFLELLQSDQVIAGTNISGAELAEMLVELVFINGGLQNSRNFLKLIPVDYLDVKGYFDYIYDLNYDNPEIFGIYESLGNKTLSNFEQQLFRHYPDIIRATRINVDGTQFRKLKEIKLNKEEIESKDERELVRRYQDVEGNSYLFFFDGVSYKSVELLTSYPNRQYDAAVDYNEPVQDSNRQPGKAGFHGYSKDYTDVPFTKAAPVKPDPTLLTRTYMPDLNVKNMLTTIAKNSTVESNRELAKYLLSIYKDFTGRIDMLVDNEMRSKGTSSPGFEGDGSYIIRINPEKASSVNDFEQTLLHEAYHPLIDMSIIRYLDNESKNRAINNNVKTLNSIFEIYKARLKEQYGSLNKTFLTQRISRENHDLINATKNLQEFVIEASTSPVVKLYLNQGIWEGNQTLLDKFIAAIQGILKALGINWGDKLADRVEQILRTQQKLVFEESLDNFRKLKEEVESKGAIQKYSFNKQAEAMEQFELFSYYDYKDLYDKFGDEFMTPVVKEGDQWTFTINNATVLQYLHSYLPEAFATAEATDVAENAADIIPPKPNGPEVLNINAGEATPKRITSLGKGETIVSNKPYPGFEKKTTVIDIGDSLASFSEGMSNFVDYASENPDMMFIVTKFDTDLTDAQIRKVLDRLQSYDLLGPNIKLPKEYEVRPNVKADERVLFDENPLSSKAQTFETKSEGMAIAKQREFINVYGPSRVSMIREEGNKFIVEVFEEADERHLFNFEKWYPTRNRIIQRQDAKRQATTRENLISNKIAERISELKKIKSLVENAYVEGTLPKDRTTIEKIQSLEKQINDLVSSRRVFAKSRNIETLERYFKQRLDVMRDLINQGNLLIFEQDKILNELNFIVGIGSPDITEHFLLKEYWDSPAIRERFTQISKEAGDIRATYTRTLINTIANKANELKTRGGEITAEQILDSFRDVTQLTAQTNNIFRATDDPLVATIGRVINEVLLNSSVQTQDMYEEMDILIEKISKKYPNNTFDIFFQDGRNYLTHFFSEKYFKALGEVWGKKGIKGGVSSFVTPWLKENTNFIDARMLFPTEEGAMYHYAGKSFSEAERSAYIAKLKDEYGEFVYERIKKAVLDGVNRFSQDFDLKIQSLGLNTHLTVAEKSAMLDDYEDTYSPYKIAERMVDGKPDRGQRTNWSFVVQPPKAYKEVDGVRKSTGLVNENFNKIASDPDLLEFWEKAHEYLRIVNTLDKEAAGNVLSGQAIPFMEQRFAESFLKNPYKFKALSTKVFDMFVEGLRQADEPLNDNRSMNIKGKEVYRTRNPITDDNSQIAKIMERYRVELMTDLVGVDTAAGVTAVFDKWGIPSEVIANDVANDRVDLAELRGNPNKRSIRYPEIDTRLKELARQEYYSTTSKDLGTIIKYYMGLATTYKNTYKVESMLNIAMDIFDRKTSRPVDAFGTEIKDLESLPNATESQLRKMLEYQMHVFFGGNRRNKGAVIPKYDRIYTKEEKEEKKRLEKRLEGLKGKGEPELEEHLRAQIDAIGKPAYFNNLMDMFLRYVHVLGLSYRVVSGNANFFVGMASNNIEAASGRFFSDSAFKRAAYLLRHSVARNMTFNKYSDPIGTKIRGFMDRNNILSDPTTELFKSASKSTASRYLRWLAPQQIVSRIEYLIQGNIALATMLDHKISEFVPGHVGDEMLWDAIDDNGKWNQEKFPISSAEYSEIIHYIKQVKETIQGSYDFDRTILAKRTLGGRIAFSFHTWVPEFIKVRFQRTRVDPFLQTTLKGRYITGYELFAGTLNDQTLRENLRSILQDLMNKSQENNTFTEHDLANIRSLIREMSMILVLYSGALMLRGLGGLGDDDRYNNTNNFLIYYLLNTAARLQGDLLTLPRFVSGQDAQRNIVPLFGLGSQLYDFIGASGDMLVEDNEDGFESLSKSVLGFFPGLTEIDRTQKFLTKDQTGKGFAEKLLLSK